MEDWQESHIKKNLPMLIRKTKCTTLLKTFLGATGIITEEEVEILTAAGDNHGAQREAKALYDILKTRPGAYETLMNVLEQTGQTGALDILKAGRKYRDLDVNKETVVTQFMDLPVELLGSVQSIREHFPGLQKETVLDLLHCDTVKCEVAEVIKSNTILKLTPDLPELHALYIGRAISNRLLLDPAIFKRDCHDIFVFKGVERGVLVDLASPHVIRASTTQLSCITCRHIHLENEEDWDDLAQVTKAPLHLVCRVTDGYILQRSSQVTSILHEHWLNKTRIRDAYLPEEKFVSQFIEETQKKGALVCDVPGMGKTWLMQSIARRIRIMSSRTVVFYIQLDSFANYLANQNGSSKGSHTLNQILQFPYTTSLAARILSLYAEKYELKIVFLFDGFDEVSHVHSENVTLFLKNLVKINFVRFIISSRPSMRAHLETTFNLISFDILPLGKKEQVASIVNRWKEKIPDGDDKKLSELAVQCIDSFKVINQKDGNGILGVPLQCYLLAEVNETSARQVCNPNRKKEFVVHEIATVVSICELYTQFFNSLIFKGVPEQTERKTCNMQTVDRFHTHKALELLFPEIAQVYLNTFKKDIETEDFALKFGVLCEGRQSKVEFIHRSFPEFLAGKFFAEFWMNTKSHDSTFVKSVGSFFIQHIMKPNEESKCRELIREVKTSIRYGMVSSTKLSIPKDIVSFRCSTVLWFMNRLYRKDTEENGPTKHFAYTIGQQEMSPAWKWFATRILLQTDVLTVCLEDIRKFCFFNIIGCVNQGFSSLLCLMISLIKAFFKDTERPALLTIPTQYKNKWADLHILLCYIVAYGCPENASEVLELFGSSPQNLLIKFGVNYYPMFLTPLEVAIKHKNLDMVLFFNHKVQKHDIRLLHIFLNAEEFTTANIKANISFIETVCGNVTKLFSCLSCQTIELNGYISLKNMIMCAWTLKYSLRHVSLENKKYFLQKVLKNGTDKEWFQLLLLLFPDEKNDGFPFPDGLMNDHMDNISEYTGQAVLENLNLDGIKMALPNDVGFISPRIHNLVTLKMLIGMAPKLSGWNNGGGYLYNVASKCLPVFETADLLIDSGIRIANDPLSLLLESPQFVLPSSLTTMTKCYVNSWNEYGRNYLHYAVDQDKIDWVEHLIECGYNINERDKDGEMPLHYVHLRSRGAKMTQILVNNGADVYAVNNKKQNFAHNVCSGKFVLGSKDSLQDVSNWVKYLIQAGFCDIWMMKDCHGKTPLDLLSKNLGTGHPITEELFTLLQTEGIISPL